MAALTRFAPTPSGYLHPGNGVSFLLTAQIARRVGARILLRIDDLDRGRFREEYLEDVFETLRWLGLDWDLGPRDARDFHASWSQHLRLPRYGEMLGRLRELGHLYACSCSRSSLRAAASDHRYPGTCRERGIPLDTPGVSWRIRVPEGEVVDCLEEGGTRRLDVHALMGDFIVLQKDGLPAYQVASLSDDILFGVDLIVRGRDLLPSTAAQLFLARCLGEAAFIRATFHHHELLLDASGEKLSKSAGAGSLVAWRRDGRSPAELLDMARRLGS